MVLLCLPVLPKALCGEMHVLIIAKNNTIAITRPSNDPICHMTKPKAHASNMTDTGYRSRMKKSSSMLQQGTKFPYS